MYIELYEDGATREEVYAALEKFMETNNYFEASNWFIYKQEDGSLFETCCAKHPPKAYASIEEWFDNALVYPDQQQWVDK